MRRLGVIVGGGLLGLGAACIPAGQFVCADHAACSQRAGGVCQADGWCSYPDQSCESDQRYSEFAGDRSGECVDPERGTSTGEGSGSGSSSGGPDTTTGPIPGDCNGVDCSGAGTCVVVDGEATCACDPGLYPVGLSCLQDPCATRQCWFVDAEQGDDAADGSRRTPWQSIARLETALGEAQPGDHFLLRRGRAWTDQLDVSLVDGALDDPIVIGAYGPIGEPKPRLQPGAVRVADSHHIVVRDLWIQDDATVPDPPNRPCVMVQNSEQVMVLGNDVRNCINRGIRVHDDAAFTVVADNVLREVDEDAIFVADASWNLPEPAVVLAHHWVIDNVIVDGTAGAGILVDLADATSDVKVMGNIVAGVEETGIRMTIAGYGWVGANVVARTGDLEAGTGPSFYLNGAEQLRVTGNVVFETPRGFEVGAQAILTNNTVLGTVETLDLATLRSNAGVQTWRDNLLLAAPGALSVRDDDPDGAGPDVTFEDHWYASDCTFRIGTGEAIDLAAWQAALMSDTGSQCAEGSGVAAAPGNTDPDDWTQSFYDALTPDAGWERCGNEAGAFACDGERLGTTVEPIEEYFEEDGFGWQGPVLVRQRYPKPD